MFLAEEEITFRKVDHNLILEVYEVRIEDSRHQTLLIRAQKHFFYELKFICFYLRGWIYSCDFVALRRKKIRVSSVSATQIKNMYLRLFFDTVL